jgi:phosphoglycolate phosphatase
MTYTAPRAIFDLDGTLVDSAPSLCAAGNALLAELGRDPVDVPTYKSFVGKGMKVQVERLLTHTGGVPDDDVDGFFARFRAHYDPLRATRAYPGAVAALTAMHAAGWRCSVCTQKPEGPARMVLSALGFSMIEMVIGGDTIPGALKPDPRMLAAAANPMGTGPAVFVGDSETDAETAAAGGLPFLLHLPGYRHGPPEAMSPAASFDDFANLPGLAAAAIGR